MDKVNLWIIVKRHILSLLAREDKRFPVSDILIFFVIPIAAGALLALDLSGLSDNFFAAAISCYSIFAALLLSVQMALFGIFQRNEPKITGKQKLIEDDRLETRRTLIRELNANVAFLTALSIVAAILSVFFLVMRVQGKIEVFVSSLIMVHFVLTALVVIKRAYLLFDVEYSNSD